MDGGLCHKVSVKSNFNRQFAFIGPNWFGVICCEVFIEHCSSQIMDKQHLSITFQLYWPREHKNHWSVFTFEWSMGTSWLFSMSWMLKGLSFRERILWIFGLTWTPAKRCLVTLNSSCLKWSSLNSLNFRRHRWQKSGKNIRPLLKIINHIKIILCHKKRHQLVQYQSSGLNVCYVQTQVFASSPKN